MVKRWTIRLSAAVIWVGLIPMMLLALLEFGLYIGHRTLGLNSLRPLVPSIKEQLVYQPYLAESDCTRTVSYTHLTLPTILRV